MREPVADRRQVSTDQSDQIRSQDGSDANEIGQDMDRGSAPTRKLCALVYVDRQVRDDVEDHFTKQWHKAWAPCYSVDLVALLRHTKRAGRLDAWRDWVLLVLLLLFVAAMGVVMLLDLVSGLIAVALTVVALSTLRVLLRPSLTWQKNQRLITGLAITAITVVSALVILLTVNPTARWLVATLAVTLAMVWLTIVGFSAGKFVVASRLRTRPGEPRHRAHPVPKDVEDRAGGLAESNVLVYAGSRAKGPLGPFVGAGHRFAQWTTPPVDTTQGKKDSEGNRGIPAPVDVVRLHQRLKRTFEDGGGLRCQHRLYADGGSLGGTPHLLTRPRIGPPVARIAEDDVLDRVERPLNYQRGYLCLQITDPKWNGDVVVTMFIRAVLDQKLLMLEVSVHALPPVSRRTRDRQPVAKRVPGPGEPSDRDRPAIPLRPISAAWVGMRCSPHLLPTVLSGVLRCGRVVVLPVITVLADSRHRRQIRLGSGFDFGVQTSFRERLALGQEMHYNAFFDTMGHVKLLQYRLVRAVADYLDACGIDLEDFTGKSETIINNHQQNIFNGLTAGAITFGQDAPAIGTVTASPAAQPPPASSTPQEPR